MTDNPIVLKRPYRPRADALLLSRVVQDAWKAENAKLEGMADQYEVGFYASLRLYDIYPQSDMRVLLKYGHACETEEVRVAVQNKGNSDRYEDVSVKLPQKILVPGTGGYSNARLNAGGPDYDESNCWGCKPDAWAKMEPEEQHKIREYWQDSTRRRLAKHTDPFFHAIIDARNAFKAEYNQATDWPDTFKRERGRWPTWGEIADKFPTVTGAAIRRLAAEV